MFPFIGSSTTWRFAARKGLFIFFIACIAAHQTTLAQAPTPFPGMQSPFKLKQLNTTLFYIQRNKNANTVFYDANFKSFHQLDLHEPIDVYYIHYASDGMRSELSILERNVAYGYHSEPIAPNHFRIQLKAFPDRILELKLEEGQPCLYTLIANQKAVLTHIYVFARPPLYTSVVYVDIWGISLMNGKELYERVYKH